MLNQPCEKCQTRQASQRHHRFPQWKKHRKIYGHIIDEPFNILYVCADCHSSHRGLIASDVWDEGEFRKAARENGFNLPDGTKSYQMKWG